MINLSNRSYTKELLDRDDIPFKDIQQNLKELNTINKYLGGHAITLAGIKAFTSAHSEKKPLIICEIGCGGGDNLKAIANYCSKQNIPATFMGIDIKADCILYAQQQYPDLDAIWITDDYQNVHFKDDRPDIIFSSLFCHHFTEDELKTMLLWIKQHAVKGFLINDLHRHPLAYYSIKWITKIFSGSYLVKNDAPLSVARGFTKKEWAQICSNAGIRNFSISWKWAFRHLIICKND
jgi:2-polyprenyl-3-methyl-5-hydroxy-6-metoxy-1,4-benzoquinol methylase